MKEIEKRAEEFAKAIRFESGLTWANFPKFMADFARQEVERELNTISSNPSDIPVVKRIWNEALEAAIEAVSKTDRNTSHWEDCWKVHKTCHAIRVIRALRRKD